MSQAKPKVIPAIDLEPFAPTIRAAASQLERVARERRARHDLVDAVTAEVIAADLQDLGRLLVGEGITSNRGRE